MTPTTVWKCRPFSTNEPQSPASLARANPGPLLNEETLIVLQGNFARRQQRRRHFQASMLRVYVDGALQVQFHPRDGVCPPFYVSEHARYLDVYGQDQAGELLIAVFPLATPTSAEETRAVLSVTHAGGQTVTLTIVSDVAETAGSAAGWRVQVTYAVTASLWRRLWLSWCDAWQRLQSWLHRLYAHRLVPACATGLILLLCLSTGWLGVVYWQQQSQSTPERWRSGTQATASILLEFQADSPEYEIRILLQSIGGRIVDGPSAEGRYIVEVALRCGRTRGAGKSPAGLAGSVPMCSALSNRSRGSRDTSRTASSDARPSSMLVVGVHRSLS